MNTAHENTADTMQWVPFTGHTLGLPNGATAGLVTVTPELAESWLALNTHNRKISPATVDRYSRDMVTGRWPFTGDPIRFSDDGLLLDGQHRLAAIVRTEIACTLLVVTGLHVDTQTFMDAGRKRHASDTLALAEMPNYIAVASLVKLALLWNPGGMWVPGRGTTLFGSRVQISTAEIIDFVEKFPETHEAARRGVAMAKYVMGARASVIGAAYLRASLIAAQVDDLDVFAVSTWFDKLETGAGLELGDPILALRNGMMRTRAEKLTNPQVPQLWKVIRAWNASRGGESLGRLIVSPTISNGNFPDMR